MKWEVYLTGRGGSPVVTDLPFHSLRFGRRLDDVSDASVSFGHDPKLVVLSESVAWRLELLALSDGEPAWAGPITRATFGLEGAELGARDLFFWFDRRLLETAFDVTDDVADIFAFVVEQALLRDASPAIEVRPEATGDIGRRTNDRSGTARAGDLLRELARTGVDFTTVGRTVYVGGRQIEAGVGPLVLTNESFADDLSLDVDGTQMASEVKLYGESADVLATAGRVDERMGLVQQVENESTISDGASLQVAADGRLELLGEEFFTVQGTLTNNATVTIAQLIPGVVIDCRLDFAYRTVRQDMRLVDVAVTVDASEKIHVRLEPVGQM